MEGSIREARGAGETGKPGIVFSDMDGTFLTFDKRMSQTNRAALDELAKREIPFVICTARASNALPQEVAEHPATRYAVCANGAYTVDVATGARVETLGMPVQNVVEIYELCESVDAVCDLFADGVAYTRRDLFERLREFIPDEDQYSLVAKTRLVTEKTVPELSRELANLDRISVFWKTEEARDAVVAYVEAHPKLTWTSSYKTVIEIMNADATKGTALAHLCAHLGIDQARSFAFGDNINDIPMIEAAGMGVAVENALPEVRSAADALTASNDDSGVGRFLLESLGL